MGFRFFKKGVKGRDFKMGLWLASWHYCDNLRGFEVYSSELIKASSSCVVIFS